MRENMTLAQAGEIFHAHIREMDPTEVASILAKAHAVIERAAGFAVWSQRPPDGKA